MHLSIPSSFFLLLATPALAALASTSEKCYTAYGPSSVSSVRSSTKTIHKTVTKTVIKNTHPHTTVTPTTHVTDTVTEVVTETDNEPTQTDTATETETDTATTTTTLDPATETSTDTTTTTTTSYGTATLPTPAGFTPILDSLPGAQIKQQSPSKRNINPRAGRFAARSKASKQGVADSQEEFKKHHYPTEVMCVDVVLRTKTVRSTRSHPGTVTKTALTSTIHETSTESSTTTTTNYPPDATDTITTTVTDTSVITESPTSTTTETETATETVAVATSTIHAACDPAQPRNFAYGMNGTAIAYVTILNSSGAQFMYTAATDEFACCEQCHSLGNCLVSDFLSTDSTSRRCHLGVSNDGTQKNGHVCATRGSGAPDGLHGQVTSNGPQELVDQVC